ncbi:hypothetical protein [Halomonas sp. H5]|uniref:hypothetical protein n=1 Tax=Halomonas sp. H5 TaxID=3423910 RepID=UPI003D3640E4
MKVHELRSIQDRIRWALSAVSAHTGENWTQSHTFENGEEHRYHVHGIKSLTQLEDELLNAFVWVWAMKDYLKAEARLRGKDPRQIEQIANGSMPLLLVSDVANGIKHGSLDNSRSGHFATIGGVGVSMPQESIASISFGAFDVTTQIERPEQAEFKADVVAAEGNVLGSAHQVLQDAIEAWERDALAYLSVAQPAAEPDGPTCSGPAG